MVLAKRTLGCYANTEAIKHYIKELDPTRLGSMAVFETFPMQYGTYHVSSSHRQDLIQSFNQFLHTYQPQLQQLKTKHGL